MLKEQNYIGGVVVSLSGDVLPAHLPGIEVPTGQMLISDGYDLGARNGTSTRLCCNSPSWNWKRPR